MELRLENVNYTYGEQTNREVHALKDVNLTIGDGEFIGLIGHTGSGKSTLVQHLNGLVRASSGRIFFNGKNIYDDDFKMIDLRSKVGLVFQYPEYQLFEEDVISDVCFGPKNLGLSDDEAHLRAQEALRQVGMGEETYKKSPFDLSGGQKRRTAIAGILAMNPDILILDEPTAGLDPEGKNKIMDEIFNMHRQRGITVIFVSHSMEDVARYAGRIIVMDEGAIAWDGTPAEVFSHEAELSGMGLSLPQVTRIMHILRDSGMDVNADIFTVDDAVREITRYFKKNGSFRPGEKNDG